MRGRAKASRFERWHFFRGAHLLARSRCPAAFELPGGGLMVDSQRVRRLCDNRVTALDDGFHDLPITVVVNINEAGAAALAELSSGKDLLRPVFNAYLVETGGRQLLIDAGAGGHLGPNSGKMLSSRKPGSRPTISARSSSPIATPTTFSALSTRTGARSSQTPSWWCRNLTNSSGCAAILQRSTTITGGGWRDERKKLLFPIAGGRAQSPAVRWLLASQWCRCRAIRPVIVATLSRAVARNPSFGATAR